MLRLNYPYLEIARNLDAGASRVWDLIIDTERWPQWGPSVRAVECVDRYIHQGSRGRVQTSVGLWTTFVVTEFENERYWSWRVGGLRATGHRVDPLDEYRSCLAFEVPLLALPYAIVCKMALDRIAVLLRTGLPEEPG